MSVHRYEDAAFLQDKLLHNINSNGWFAGLCDGFQRSRYPNMPSGLVRSVTMQTFLRADPIYVSDDVMTLWEHAAPKFKMEVFQRDDLVVPAGFALLPRPFTMIDRHGKRVMYRAIAWLPISGSESHNWNEGERGQGVWLTLLSHMDDIDDYWTDTHIMKDGTSGAQIRQRAMELGEPWSLMHGSPLVFGVHPEFGITDEDGNEVPDPEQDNAAGVYGDIQCFWRLMSQLVMVPESLPRQARRQRQREQRPSDVKVLKLRRSRPAHDHDLPEGPGVEYTHQWVVEGHWRHQPFGPREDPQYKQIWIAPYVKGPEDKPLIIKRRGVEFTR